MTIFGNFFEKNENLWHFKKNKIFKCQVFDNFLTFRLQFSGGSDMQQSGGNTANSHRVATLKDQGCQIGR